MKNEKQKLQSLKDGGTREKFQSGMIREANLGRGRYDLISPIALKELAVHLELGAMKYEERNWEKGGPHSRHLNSALRHLQDFLSGDRSENHLAACIFNCMAIQHNSEMIKRGKLSPKLNDLPNYTEE